jgi:hypothetical protein
VGTTVRQSAFHGTLKGESKFENSTHLGTEYAALLVADGYRPPETADNLPEKGRYVIAVASAKGEASRRPVSRTLHFSGYEWEIRGLPSNRGGASNTYDPANAWTDEDGSAALAHRTRPGAVDLRRSESHTQLRIRNVSV